MGRCIGFRHNRGAHGVRDYCGPSQLYKGVLNMIEFLTGGVVMAAVIVLLLWARCLYKYRKGNK